MLLAVARPDYREQGYSQMLSRKFNISRDTARAHISNIAGKFRVSGIFSIVLHALNYGIITLDEIGEEYLQDIRSQLPYMTNGQRNVVESMYKWSLINGSVNNRYFDKAPATVKNHRSNICTRFRISNPAHLALVAYLLFGRHDNLDYGGHAATK